MHAHTHILLLHCEVHARTGLAGIDLVCWATAFCLEPRASGGWVAVGEEAFYWLSPPKAANKGWDEA
jgi:hypothetical protein